MTDDALAQFLRGIDMEAIAPPVNRTTASLELVRRRLWSRSRICPRCMRQSNATSIYFDFCLSLRCEEHQIFLLDHCTSCNQPLTYFRKRSFHCDCGQALANLPAIKVDSSLDLFESLFTPWRGSDDWYLSEETVLGQEVKTAMALRVIINFVTGNSNSSTKNQPWVWLEDWPIIKALISPWPTALSDTVLASDTLKDSERLNQLLIYLDDSKHPILLKLKQKLDDYRKDVRRPVSANCEPLVSLNQVRKLAKLDAAAATALFNSSYFTVTEIRHGPNGPNFWVGQAEFEQLMQWLNETVNLTQAAKIIGCSPMCVRGLSRMGRLKAVYLPYKPRSPRFLRSTIDLFIKSIEVRLKVSSKEALVSLAQVAPAQTNCKRWCSNWPVLIEGIFAGTVPIYRLNHRRGWEGIGIRVDDLKGCIYTAP